jgi:7-cyano-7-deazaguanine synthase
MSKQIAVVLMSGGMDSCVTAAIAATQGHELAALHFNYGQRTEPRELQAFDEIARHFDVQRRLVVSFEHLAMIGGSSITDTTLPVTKANLSNTHIPTSYVPFRNANMLSAAVSWAEVIGASKIFVGAVQEDSSGYPDCRREFYDAFEQTIAAGTKPTTSITIITPIIHLNKMQIVLRGIELNAPLHLTWSCYQNSEIACGVCDSCALRLRGFHLAGIEDPLPYANRPLYV